MHIDGLSGAWVRTRGEIRSAPPSPVDLRVFTPIWSGSRDRFFDRSPSPVDFLVVTPMWSRSSK